jgi:hypothetical protein
MGILLVGYSLFVDMYPLQPHVRLYWEVRRYLLAALPIGMLSVVCALIVYLGRRGKWRPGRPEPFESRIPSSAHPGESSGTAPDEHVKAGSPSSVFPGVALDERIQRPESGIQTLATRRAKESS